MTTYGPDPGGHRHGAPHQSTPHQSTAYQGLATPAGGQAHPRPARSGRGGLIALAVALVLAVAGAGAFAALWSAERGEHSTTRDTLGRVEQKVADTEDALARSDEAKRVAETKLGELAKCGQAGRDLIEALDGGDSATNRDRTTDALDRMDSFC